MDDPRDSPAQEALLQTRSAVVLVIDLVESVRAMEADELGVVQRWQAFCAEVNQYILPPLQGRIVKSLGDGLMVEFQLAQNAVRAASAMHEWMAIKCTPMVDGTRLGLRAGIHVAMVFDGVNDIYGIGVNLAARVATLAAPGETIATTQVRDLLDDTLDAEIEDLGDCHLKHVQQAVRAYRLGPGRHPESLPQTSSYGAAMLASVAVIPFSNLNPTREFWGIGDLLADGVINALSLSPTLRVVSRLSSACFSGRGATATEIGARLDVRYIVSGNYGIHGKEVFVGAELSDAATGTILWSGRARGHWRALLEPECELVQGLAESIHQSLLQTAALQATHRPLPSLSSYELFLGAIAMMHRAHFDDFERSRYLLESLSERHRRVAAPQAWLGKWYVLRNIQGASTDGSRSAGLALEHTHRALDLEPSSALALAIEGFVYCHLKKDVETADARLREACAVNPNEGLAWLFFAVVSAFQGRSNDALDAGRRALALSPIDPLRYYYESLMGSCEFGAGNPAAAVRWCEVARRRNRRHLSTLRILIAGYAETGEEAQARAIAQEIRRLRPDFTVAVYEAQSVAALFPFGRRIARAMRMAGIP
ncbi:adenylate/guanylate cyclase domain-containing protein [Variovorax dokdonensis]|uniref:Adenylate/guanylate cyclase domain-containing protein n=1 Tax=Variovorax dokdonensis TaxID=344883 RepID=A0ABT7NCM9_9BURK|nr:adenylate/guanylate cyclase domain-containing protein [Variovorax dokdonensis]MDM0045709.1 adenylate/guanylate cyclase domain-containing protein [Variovorax dokdonensis]